MRIVITGGGSGGHLVPLIAVAKKIKEKDANAEFLYIGPKGKMEEEMIESAGVPAKFISAGKVRRYLSVLNFSDTFRTFFGVLKSLWILLVYMPDAIFSKGGYASFPAVLAGWLYHIPILVHESDSRPGTANSILGKFARRIAISYPESAKDFELSKTMLTGNPLRDDIDKGSVQKAREKFSLQEAKQTIFVWGGSQGAQIINENLLKILPQLLKKFQIIHQTGEINYTSVVHEAASMGIKAGREGYHPVPFIHEGINDILAASDLVISRAGANSISEIAANGKPAIFIPIDGSANDHQRMNAYSLSRLEACLVLDQNNLGSNLFLEKIEEMLTNQELREKYSQNIRQFYHPDATQKIADGILEMVSN